MNKINFHIHSIGSDGKLSPEDVVKEAIRAGITYLCFTDHFKRPEGTTKKDGWDNNFYAEDYAVEILNLKEKYKTQINIFIGAELDWLEGYEIWIKEVIHKNNFDFVLGSVHRVELDGEFIPVPLDEETLSNTLMKFKNDYKELVKKYYKQQKLLVKSQLFDCVSHFDFVKMYNENNSLFSEKEEWYKRLVLENLELIKEKGMCLEINTAGWRYPIQEQYPSEWILIEARKKGIPITIGTDSHDLSVSEGLEEAYELARKVGYKSILIFKNRKSIEIQI